MRHDTASMVVIDVPRQAVLLVFHNAMRKWVFPGGHIDDGETIPAAAIREVKEETGVTARLYAPAHWNHPHIEVAEYVAPAKPDRPGKPAEPEHLHDDYLYIGTPVGSIDLTPQLDEVEGARWVNVFQLNDLTVRDEVPDRAMKAYWLLRMAAEDFGDVR